MSFIFFISDSPIVLILPLIIFFFIFAYVFYSNIPQYSYRDSSKPTPPKSKGSMIFDAIFSLAFGCYALVVLAFGINFQWNYNYDNSKEYLEWAKGSVNPRTIERSKKISACLNNFDNLKPNEKMEYYNFVMEGCKL